MIIGFLLLLFVQRVALCQSWTAAQLAAANTAKDAKMLSKEEKDMVLYINLARLYPKAFAQLEIKPYKGLNDDEFLTDRSYKTSLIKEMNALQPLTALSFDQPLYNSAKCFSEELAERGSLSHIRKKCPAIPLTRISGECISQGYDRGREVVIAWLIDNGVPDLGHRKRIFEPRFVNIGVSNTKKGDMFSVADFNK